MFNGARLVGPSVAGLLISLVGEGMCFLLNGVSYLAVIIALMAMRIKPWKIEVKKGPNTILLGGIACVAGALLFGSRLPAVRKIILPIYEEKLR